MGWCDERRKGGIRIHSLHAPALEFDLRSQVGFREAGDQGNRREQLVGLVRLAVFLHLLLILQLERLTSIENAIVDLRGELCLSLASVNCTEGERIEYRFASGISNILPFLLSSSQLLAVVVDVLIII